MVTCPKCGSTNLWDNRAKKASGEFKATAPDYKCKDKHCDGVIWPPKGGRLTHDDQEPEAVSPPAVIDTPDRAQWSRLMATYSACRDIAVKVWPKGTEDAVLQAATATLFIAAHKEGLSVQD